MQRQGEGEKRGLRGGMVPLAFRISPYDEVFTIAGPYNLDASFSFYMPTLLFHA